MVEERFVPSRTTERNLGMELVRVTEAAALSAGRFMGRGDKIKIDDAAVKAMRQALDGVDMHGGLGEAVADLLGRDEQEAAGFFEHTAELRQRLEALWEQ